MFRIASGPPAVSPGFIDPIRKHPEGRAASEKGNQTNGESEERRERLSRRLSSRSKSNRRLAAAAFRKLRITSRQPSMATSTTKISPSLITIAVREERCHTFRVGRLYPIRDLAITPSLWRSCEPYSEALMGIKLAAAAKQLGHSGLAGELPPASARVCGTVERSGNALGIGPAHRNRCRSSVRSGQDSLLL